MPGTCGAGLQEHILQLDDVGVLQASQDADLSQDPLGIL